MNNTKQLNMVLLARKKKSVMCYWKSICSDSKPHNCQLHLVFDCLSWKGARNHVVSSAISHGTV